MQLRPFQSIVLLALLITQFWGASSLAQEKPFYHGGNYRIDCSSLLSPAPASGPQYLLRAKPYIHSINPAKLEEATFLSFNILDFKQNREGDVLKPRHQIEGVVEVINRTHPLIATLQEVESLDLLKSLDQYGLNDQYERILVPGNSDRGIQVGFLVSSDLDADILIQSHKYLEHEHLGQTEKLFSRDFPVLSFLEPGAPADSRPMFIFAGTHLKSQRTDPDDLDPLSKIKRTAQVEMMIEILQSYQKRFPGVPIIFGGDFNANLTTFDDFNAIREAGMVSSFDTFGIAAGTPERTTQVYFQNGAPPSGSQLDDIFVDAETAKSVKSVRVVPYVNYSNREVPLPRSYRERKSHPSDHRAIELKINLKQRLAQSFTH